MSIARPANPVEEQPHPHVVPTLNDNGSDGLENDGMEEIAEETGIDLTEASELDADNVPADEEAERVVHAPD